MDDNIIPFKIKKSEPKEEEDIFAYSVDVYKDNRDYPSAIIKYADSYEAEDLFRIGNEFILLAFLLFQQADKAGLTDHNIVNINRIHENGRIINLVNTDLVQTREQFDWVKTQLVHAGTLVDQMYEPPLQTPPS